MELSARVYVTNQCNLLTCLFLAARNALMPRDCHGAGQLRGKRKKNAYGIEDSLWWTVLLKLQKLFLGSCLSLILQNQDDSLNPWKKLEKLKIKSFLLTMIL